MKREELDATFDEQFTEISTDNSHYQRNVQLRRNKWVKRILIMTGSFLFGAALFSLPQMKGEEIQRQLEGSIQILKTPAQFEKMTFNHERTTVILKEKSGPKPPPIPWDAPESNGVFLDPDRYVRNYDLPEESPYEYELTDTKTNTMMAKIFKKGVHPKFEYNNWGKMLNEMGHPFPEYSYLPDGHVEDNITVVTSYGRRNRLHRSLYYSKEKNKTINFTLQWHNPDQNYGESVSFSNKVNIEKISLKNGLEGILVHLVTFDVYELYCLYDHVLYSISSSDFPKEELIKIMENIQPVPADDPSLFEVPERYKKFM